MKKTIGILAHVDAGKTTFTEQLLYHTKGIAKRGRVDHKDSFLDSHEIEKARGITVFADQGYVSYKGSEYYFIDTPGHIDFSPEMERSIQIMDYAIVIISAVEGVEGHTETVWELLRKHNVPTFFFINKIDRVGADVERVIGELKLNFSPNLCDISDTSTLFSQGEMAENLIEFLAERDEILFEHYLEKGYDKSLWLDSMINMIIENKIFPYSTGSALQDIGITSFIDTLHLLTKTDYSNHNKFGGLVYKIRHEDNGARWTFIKAFNGKLKVRDELSYGKNENTISEKITQIRVYSGNKYKVVNEIEAGELFAVSGLSTASIGDGVGLVEAKADYELIPTLKSKVIAEATDNIKDILRCFNMLDAEDPSLNVTWEESLQQIHIHVMGKIQLEVLEKLVKDRFNYTVTFDKPEIIYKESIDSSVYGYGHFEPLGHYAEVHLKLEPAKRNSGISFINESHPDNLSIGHQNLILHHIFEREHHGILTGSPITDIKITLVNGRAHNTHTSGGDFREATHRAIRQGLEKAKNILLEPYYAYKIKVDTEHIGKVISDIQNAHGSFDTPNTIGNKVIISGRVPVATFMNYSSELAAFTQGKGSINLSFSGYYQCHNEQEAIERINYNKDADYEYTSSSIFCTKGKGYSVPWEEVENKMHCLKK